MAFQMIPPRVSSSPPPLDSLPSVTCTGDDDDDDEFGSFATHTTFDITGLSDKLPPTPECSPSKFPPKEGGSQGGVNNLTAASNQVQQKNDIKDVIELERKTSSSPPPPLDNKNLKEFSANLVVSDINGECLASLEIGDDNDEFGDFSFCASDRAAGEARESCHGDRTELGGKSSSQKCSLASQNPDVSSPSNSDRSFSMIATPPPLDHVVDNVMVDDEFSRISPNPPPAPPVVVCDDDFGDFESCAFDIPKGSSSLAMGVVDEVCVTSRSNSVDVDESFVTECEFRASESNDGVNLDQQTEESVSDVARDFGDVSSSEVSELSSLHERGRGDSNRSENIDGLDLVTERTRHSEKVNSSTSDTDDHSLPNRDASNEAHSDDRVREDDVEVYNSRSSECGRSLGTDTEDCIVHRGFPRSSNLESLVAQNLGNASSEPYYHSSSSSLEVDVSKEGFHHEEVSACSISSSKSGGYGSSVVNVDRTEEESTSIVNRKSNGVPQEDVDSAKGLDYIKDDVDGESNLDFGEFNKADDDDDDLDFGDLRDQVCGTFGAGESADDADAFGDFYEYDASRVVSPPVLCGEEEEEEDLEFGDFGMATAKSKEDAEDDFGDFTKVEYKDDFGSFASPNCPKFAEEGAALESTYGDDEFGDFTSQQSAEKQSESFRVSWHDSPSLSTSTDTPVLRKLESLILKWIPRESLTTSLSQESHRENHAVPTLFQSVEDDAFVWRQLENLESSAALTLSWGSTQAQTLYLSSVNVDARNILFGHKWSSSVPLFAQTLSFSPLTPAKPTENGGGGTLDGGNRGGSVSPPILASSAMSPKFNASFNKDQNEVEIPPVNENAPEEQIPPAKFDWTSSGLTNPLEGPGLEREFLSEGGEKGAISRLKGPPAPSPLVQQILSSGKNSSTPSAATPLQSLSSDIREVVEHIPDIDFMRSRVLMFPIRGDE